MLKNRQGEVNINYQGYEMAIINYISNVNIDIKFINNNSIRYKKGYKEFKNGSIKNLYHPEIYGIGYCGDGLYNSTKHPKHYDVWRSMLKRIYNRKGEHYEYYKDCTVDESWHNFQNFAKWFEENYIEDFQLDKDILVKGNKVYSPETCCFVPQEINKLFTKRDSKRGDYPIGVGKYKNSSYSAQITLNNSHKYIGTFNTPEEAFEAYKIAKEDYIKEVADKWRGLISSKVFEVMYSYKVEIID